MRNPCLMTGIVDKIFGFHHNVSLREQVSYLLPLDKDNLGVDKVINEWAPIVKARLPIIRRKIITGSSPLPNLMRAIDAVDRYCLFQGYQEYFRSLVCRDEIVFSHCDTQENNILASLDDNRKVTLIDFEYACWNPQSWDLANYLNEC